MKFNKFGRLYAALIALSVACSSWCGTLGDFAPSSVIYGKFTTYQPSTGAAFALAGTPALSVYKDNSTTQSTTGVTLTASFDSVTGLNHFAIDTSADGTFYSAGSNFDICITTGTVDSVSVVGACVASFSLNKTAALRPAIAGRQVVVDAAGLADANAVKIGPTGAGTAQTARDLGASVLLSSGTGAGQISLSSGAVLLQATQAGVTIPTVTTVTNLTNAPTSGDFTATMKTSLGTAVASLATAADLATVEGFVDNVESRLGVPGNLGGGATVAGNLADIEAQTDDIGIAGAGLTATDDAIMTRVGAPTGASIAADIAALNDLSATDVGNIVVETQGGTITLRCALAIVAAYAAGDVTTTATDSTYKDSSGSQTRITGSAPTPGNRNATVTCPSY